MGSFNRRGEYKPRTLIGHRESSDFVVKLGFLACLLFALFLALVAVAPFAWMLITSFQSTKEIFVFPAQFWPSEFNLSTYQDALQRLPFMRYLGNSLFTSLGTVFLQLTFSSLAAYALSRLKPKFGRFILFMIIATLMIPFESLVIPLYLQMRDFPFGSGPGTNLLNTYVALILPSAVSAFDIFVLKGFFDRLPEEILYTARLDGCSEWRIFLRFALPMSRPIMTVLGIFGFISSWNAFFWPLVALNDPSMYTLMLGLQKLVETGEPWNIVMAAVTLTTVPTIILFLFFQRWIERGMAFSGLQG